jgi:hypothetical protein
MILLGPVERNASFANCVVERCRTLPGEASIGVVPREKGPQEVCPRRDSNSISTVSPIVRR